MVMYMYVYSIILSLVAYTELYNLIKNKNDANVKELRALDAVDKLLLLT